MTDCSEPSSDRSPVSRQRDQGKPRLSFRLLVATGCLAVFIQAGCDGPPPERASSVQLTLDSANASAPTTDVSPQNGIVYFSWFGMDADGRSAVFVSHLEPGQPTPSPPIQVNPAGVSVSPHPQAPAQVAAGDDGLVLVAWSTREEIPGRRFPASDLLLARSTDGGRTFSSPVAVNDDAGGPPAGHTFHDLAYGPDGTIYVSWLDSRGETRSESTALVSPDETGGHHHQQQNAHDGHAAHSATGGRDPAASGLATPNEPSHHEAHVHSDTDVRIARSIDGGLTFSESVVVARGSCQCCRTALFVGDDNTVYLAWRHIYDDNIRDIAFASSSDGGRTFTTPIRVHTDDWQVEGCPHSGPALSVDSEGTVHISWYTAATNAAGLRYATSTDGGRSFAEPRNIESGVPQAHAQLTGGRRAPVWVVWEDPLADQICAAPAGDAPASSDQKLTFAGTMPAISATEGTRVVTWQNKNSVHAFVERPHASSRP